MLKVEINEHLGFAVLEPDGELSVSDFDAARKIIDPYLSGNGDLTGIIIYVRFFPGWDSFASFLAHLKFVNEHHKKVARVAFATDSLVGMIVEPVAGHFVSAEVKNFDFDEFEAAKRWVVGAATGVGGENEDYD